MSVEVSSVSLVYDFKNTRFLPNSEQANALLFQDLFWSVIRKVTAPQRISGFLGISGCTAVSKNGLKITDFKSEFDSRAVSVLKLFIKQNVLDYDTITGKTKHGAFKFGLTLCKDLALTKKRIQLDNDRLRKLIVGSSNQDKPLAAQHYESKLQNFRTSLDTLLREIDGTYDQFKEQLQTINRQYRDLVRLKTQEEFNAKVYEMLVAQPPRTIDDKKKIAAWIKQELDQLGFSIQNPDDGTACGLIILQGYDEQGVYLLESKEGRKRSHTSSDLHELLPLQLMDNEHQGKSKSPYPMSRK